MDSHRKDDVIDFETRCAEKKILSLSAKVAVALVLLVDVQQELEELYISLDDADETM